ncbi:ATP/GTP-binding protein [Streptomyces sp. LN699]|uniref:ATP/GTP-binding protein n=1 Tax=Streptomyces sp. LN699 TaxID=3112981 RepID=UPI003724B6D7
MDCDITAQDPGKPGGDGSGKPSCAIDATPVPCSTPEMGVFSAADSCYWKETTGPAGGLPPGFDTGAPAGWRPGDPGGSLYLVTCPRGSGDVRGGIRWSATGTAGGVDVQALAQQAVEKLRLEGPDIGIVPRPDGTGLVGMPVWMWSNLGPSRTGPTSASASAGSVTVTATARVRTIVWSMGDGATVPCAGPGTPYEPAFGKQSSPTCGHTYTRTSATAPGGRLPGQPDQHLGRPVGRRGPERDADGRPCEFHRPGDRRTPGRRRRLTPRYTWGGNKGGDIGGDKGGSMGGHMGGSG